MPTAAELGVVSVEDVVANLYRLEYTPAGRALKFRCPNPRHSDRTPSCYVYQHSGYFHCYSCGVGGDLAELGVLALGAPRSEVEAMLAPNSHEAVLQIVKAKLGNRRYRPQEAELQLVPPGPYEDGPLTYLRGRGFTAETLQKWGVRFCAEQELQGSKAAFILRSSIAIPIRDEHHRLLAWCYRATPSSPSWQPRYLYSNDVANFWFGLEHNARSREIVVVEGALDAMWVDQCGYPALGLLGSGMVGSRGVRRTKVMRLQNYERVYLLGDRDAAGATWVNTVGEALGGVMPVYRCSYGRWTAAKDPAELSPVDLELMIARAVPWARWRMRNIY